MNSNQKELLGVLKKFDSFCEEHKITYYLGGGTALGAIRHHGFIPWDDDIDLYITRNNAEKLRKHKKELEEIRLCYIDQKEFPLYGNTIIRLSNLDDTMFHSARMIDKAPKGRMIELFILDPIPRDKDLQLQWKKKQWVYTELIDTAFTAANYNKLPYIDFSLYNFYLEKCQKEGTENVLLELEEDLFSIDEEDCDEYCIRWCGNDICFKKEWIGEPRKVIFEDAALPILPGAEFAFRTEYGNKWMYIPDVQETTHAFVLNETVPYPVYVEDYRKFIDKDEIEEAYQGKKKASIWRYVTILNTLRKSQLLHKHRVIAKLKKDIVNGKPKDELYETWKTTQLSPVFKSTKTYLPIEENHLYSAMVGMIKDGEYENVLEILSWKEKDEENTEELKELQNFLLEISEGYIEVYRDNISCAKKHIDRARELAPELVSFDLLYLTLLLGIEENDEVENLQQLADNCESAISYYPNKPELLFVQGNAQRKLNNHKLAKFLYEKCAAQTKNGMIYLYIKDYLKEYGGYND